MPHALEEIETAANKPHPSPANKAELREVIDLLVTPILPQGAEVPFVISRNPETDTVSISHIRRRDAAHLAEPIIALVYVGWDVALPDRFDWREDKYSFELIGPAERPTAHDRIETQVRLSAIADKNGADWAAISSEYQSALSMAAALSSQP